jgi:hypothetical protein
LGQKLHPESDLAFCEIAKTHIKLGLVGVSRLFMTLPALTPSVEKGLRLSDFAQRSYSGCAEIWSPGNGGLVEDPGFRDLRKPIPCRPQQSSELRHTAPTKVGESLDLPGFLQTAMPGGFAQVKHGPNHDNVKTNSTLHSTGML